MNEIKLDYYLPKYDYVERHKIVVNSSPEKIFNAVKNLDFSGSKLIALLFGIRNTYAKIFTIFRTGVNDRAPISLTPDFAEMLGKAGFIHLDENLNREIVLGLVGKFWQPGGGIVKGLIAEDFLSFRTVGYAKACMNFLIAKQPDDSLLLTTETRIQCYGAAAKTAFTVYWAIIKPFSGLTRRIMLKTIKKQGEGTIKYKEE